MNSLTPHRYLEISDPEPDRIYARYFIETAFPLERAAATMAGEQSTGTFLRVPGETDKLREQFAARVETIEEGEPSPTAALPGSGIPKNSALRAPSCRRPRAVKPATPRWRSPP